MATQPSHFYRQSGVIPIRHSDGSTEVLLITSLRKKRWIIPKGIVEPGLSPSESAAKEAWEEAGVRGHVYPVPMGEYRYPKWGGLCRVEVFLLEVREILEQWPESNARERRWLDVDDAARRVREDGLRAILRRIPEHLDSQRPGTGPPS